MIYTYVYPVDVITMVPGSIYSAMMLMVYAGV